MILKTPESSKTWKSGFSTQGGVGRQMPSGCQNVRKYPYCIHMFYSWVPRAYLTSHLPPEPKTTIFLRLECSDHSETFAMDSTVSWVDHGGAIWSLSDDFKDTRELEKWKIWIFGTFWRPELIWCPTSPWIKNRDFFEVRVFGSLWNFRNP